MLNIILNNLHFSVLLLALPFINFFCLFFFGRHLGKTGSLIFVFIFNLALVFLSISFFTLFIIDAITSVYLDFGTWIYSGYKIATWSFSFNGLSIIMILVVSVVSSLVHLYSIDYMGEDPFLTKFLSYLSLFTFFMLVLVTADNLIVLFVGWEGVGLCSYLLVGFWTTRAQAVKSAFKALLMNRVGDFFFLAAACFIVKYFKTTDFSTIFALAPFFKEVQIDIFTFRLSVVDISSLFLIFAAFGKSAQIGLHTWLPDAMEGPTPVSALIHAATMVTAGVFLVVRSAFLIDLSNTALTLLIIFGLLTTIMSGLIALGQWDIKKIIAFSTCSQLGYMFLACGLSSYLTGFFHLATHAFFKALLFLSAGYIIHLFAGEQDIRRMGSLVILSPLSYVLVLVASLALMGIVGLSGYYSKEMIVHAAAVSSDFSKFNWIVYFFVLFSIFLTVLYSLKLIYFVFFMDLSNLNKGILDGLRDKIGEMRYIKVSLVLLGFLSVFSGYYLKDLFNGNFFFKSIYAGGSLSRPPVHSEFIGQEFDFFILFLSVLFILIVFKEFKNRRNLYKRVSDSANKGVLPVGGVNFWYILTFFYRFFNNKFYFDIFYNFLARKIIFFSFYIFEVFEKGILEVFGPEGVSRAAYILARGITRFHSGYLHHYANMLACTALFTLIWYIFLFN